MQNWEILPPYEDAETQMLSALLYPLWPLLSWPILLARRGPEHRYIRFHAWQAVNLGALGTLILVAATILFVLMVKWIPWLGSLGLGTSFVLGFVVLIAGWLLLLGYQMLLAWRAQQGQIFMLPIIGARAREKVYQAEAALVPRQEA